MQAAAAAQAAAQAAISGGSVTVTPTGNVHPPPPLQIPISVAASLMASVSSKPQVEIKGDLNPSVTVSLAPPTATPQVLKEEVISSGQQSSPPSVIVTPSAVAPPPTISNGNGFKNELKHKVEVTPILDENSISEAKRAKLD